MLKAKSQVISKFVHSFIKVRVRKGNENKGKKNL